MRGRLGQSDDGEEQSGHGRARRLGIGGIDGFVGLQAEATGQPRGEVAAGGKADRRELGRIEPPLRRTGADDPHRALCTLERHVRPGSPAVMWQAVEQ